MTTVTVTRECPRCGKVSVHTIPYGVRAHVSCPSCGLGFEISAITPQIKKGAVGAPGDAAGKFDYEPASSHQTSDGLRRRLRQYARIAAWGPA